MSRASVATVVLSLSILNPIVCAQVSSPPPQLASEIVAVQGKVLGPEGRPVSGIHIEIDDATTAIPVMSTYTQQDGTFEVQNIPKGTYEVIAATETSEVSDHIFVEPGRRDVELRLPARTVSATTPDTTVSVARMLVPPSARKLYNKALVAFQKGKKEDADRYLDAALQIDPQFADAITLRAVIRLGASDLTEARQLLEHAIEVDSTETSAYIALAAVYNHEGRFDDALRVSEKGAALAPRAWQAYLEMAKASIAKAMYHEGLKLIRQAQRLGGDTCAEVHLMKAYALVPLKLYKDAKYELQAALSREHKGSVAEQAQNMLAQVNELESAGLLAQR